MRHLILIAVFLLMGTGDAFSHPGKTDRWGGHKCRKDCGEWDLLHGEYHLHNEDYTPIRVERKRRPSGPEESPQPEILPAPAPEDPPADAGNETAVSEKKKDEPVVRSEIILLKEIDIFDPTYGLLGLAAVLLLVLLFLMRRKKKAER